MAEERNLERISIRMQLMDHYLDDPAHMARFRAELLTALRDPTYITHRNIFDWKRFALEFSTPAFNPPLNEWELFDYLIHPHYALNWRRVPRSRIWWLLCLVVDVEHPLAWLQEQQLLGHRGTMVRIAKQLDCSTVTNTDLFLFLNRYRPSIPVRFQIDGMSILAVMSQGDPPGVWGLVYGRSRGQLARLVVFYEEMNLLPFHRPPPREQSLHVIIEALLARHSFDPQIILFYPGCFIARETGRVIWGGLTVDKIEQLADTTPGPVLVKGWDEDGWPIGQRVALTKTSE